MGLFPFLYDSLDLAFRTWCVCLGRNPAGVCAVVGCYSELAEQA